MSNDSIDMINNTILNYIKSYNVRFIATNNKIKESEEFMESDKTMSREGYNTIFDLVDSLSQSSENDLQKIKEVERNLSKLHDLIEKNKERMTEFSKKLNNTFLGQKKGTLGKLSRDVFYNNIEEDHDVEFPDEVIDMVEKYEGGKRRKRRKTRKQRKSKKKSRKYKRNKRKSKIYK